MRNVIGILKKTLTSVLVATSITTIVSEFREPSASYNLHAPAVPKAETWAMMVVGLGLIGTLMHRLRRTVSVGQG